MLFNSYEFLLAFLPLAVLGYFALKGHGNLFLVAASLFFYAWWRVEFIALLIASIAVNFTIGRAIVQRAARGEATKALLVAGIAFDLLLLGYFKYANFFAENVAALLGIAVPKLDVVLPIGISFFTFTQIAFLVDAHQKKAAEPNLTNYALFVTYFPHLLAGPILHHREMMPQFADASLKRVDWDNVARGLALLAIGLAKKVLIADPLSVWANAGFAAAPTLGFGDAWLATLCYTLQLYFDFSGYTDMALGMALMMNIRLPENFNSPYRSRNLQDFWRRWHMTLMRFLRDYVYIPLGGNRRGATLTAAFLVLTFTLGGLWHGANWTFVLWGLANGLGLVVVRLWSRTGIAMPVFLAWAITFLAVNLGWVLFRAPDLATAGSMYQALVGAHGFGALTVTEWRWIPSLPQLTLASAATNWDNVSTFITLLAAGFIAAWPRNSMAIVREMRFGWPLQAATALALVAGVLALANPTEFLYFNF
ncbi:MBOAT family O-acyltransferase [Usitatibacter palustris]|uniref:Probable alginate O-acetylase AlgI n=1 Tax=Usitatibacter palustris TaxID=2732487 RepID=A0A6M4HBE6_9PROT|nr:MBOAT family protein [Usitatibacter palustris]QJR16178.1 Peptidoglycan O-acetyltransferase [Usitatibacter palustris]